MCEAAENDSGKMNAKLYCDINTKIGQNCIN